MILDFLRKHNNTVSVLLGVGLCIIAISIGVPIFWALLSASIAATTYFVLMVRSQNRVTLVATGANLQHLEHASTPSTLNNRSQITPSYTQPYSPSLSARVFPEIRAIEETSHERLKNLTRDFNRTTLENERRMQKLIDQNDQSNQGVSRALNSQTEKNTATYAKQRSEIKTEMAQDIQKKKEEHEANLKVFSGNTSEREKLVLKQEQEIAQLTKEYEDKLAAHKNQYEQRTAMMQNMRVRKGF